MSYRQKILLENTTVTTYITTIDAAGREEYFYLAVDVNKLKILHKAATKENFVPEQYGRIVSQGYGTPSAEVKAHMEETYGCLHKQAIKLTVSSNE